MVVPDEYGEYVPALCERVEFTVVFIGDRGRLQQHIVLAAGLAELVKLMLVRAERLDRALFALFDAPQYMVVFRQRDMLEHDGGHIIAALRFKGVARFAVPRDDLRIKRLVTAALGIRAAVEQIQVEHRLSRPVRTLDRDIVCPAAVHAVGLFADAGGVFFVDVIKLVVVGNTNLPVVVAEGDGKGDAAACNGL